LTNFLFWNYNSIRKHPNGWTHNFKYSFLNLLHNSHSFFVNIPVRFLPNFFWFIFT
jgi:hypothetical protein